MEADLEWRRLRALENAERVDWLRQWMARHGYANANQAAAALALSRQSVERMLYEGSRLRTLVGDQTLLIAHQRDRLAARRKA